MARNGVGAKVSGDLEMTSGARPGQELTSTKQHVQIVQIGHNGLGLKFQGI